MLRLHKGKSIIDFPKNFVVVDIEATGYSPVYDFIIEVGAIKVSNGEITGTFSSLIYQDIDMHFNYKHTVDLTGINQSMLEHCTKRGGRFIKIISIY